MEGMKIEILDATQDAPDILAVLHESGDRYRGMKLEQVLDIGGTWFGVRDTHGRLVACLWAILGYGSAYLDYLASVHPGAGIRMLRVVVQAALPRAGIRHIFAIVSYEDSRWCDVLARLGAEPSGMYGSVKVHVQPPAYATNGGGQVPG
jgi:hypothetical protein